MQICITRPVGLEFISFVGSELEEELTIQREYRTGTVLDVEAPEDWWTEPDTTFFCLPNDWFVVLPNDAWCKRVLTVKEAAAILEYGDSTVYDLYRKGALKGYDEGGIRIFGESVQELIHRNSNTSREAGVGANVLSPEPEPKRAPRAKKQPTGRRKLKTYEDVVVIGSV